MCKPARVNILPRTLKNLAKRLAFTTTDPALTSELQRHGLSLAITRLCIRHSSAVFDHLTYSRVHEFQSSNIHKTIESIDRFRHRARQNYICHHPFTFFKNSSTRRSPIGETRTSTKNPLTLPTYPSSSGTFGNASSNHRPMH